MVEKQKEPKQQKSEEAWHAEAAKHDHETKKQKRMRNKLPTNLQ